MNPISGPTAKIDLHLVAMNRLELENLKTYQHLPVLGIAAWLLVQKGFHDVMIKVIILVDLLLRSFFPSSLPLRNSLKSEFTERVFFVCSSTCHVIGSPRFPEFVSRGWGTFRVLGGTLQVIAMPCPVMYLSSYVIYIYIEDPFRPTWRVKGISGEAVFVWHGNMFVTKNKQTNKQTNKETNNQKANARTLKSPL